MAKHKKNRPPQQQKALPLRPGPAGPASEDGAAFPGKRALAVMGAGLVLIVLGYVLLKKADPAGKNLFASLAPFALLAGYLLIPAALYADGKTDKEKVNLPKNDLPE